MPRRNPLSVSSLYQGRSIRENNGICQNKLIDSLQVRLSGYIENFGPGRAKIDVSVEALNMRSEPSLSGDVLSRIPNGSIVGVLYFDDKEEYLDGATGKWCRIKYIGQEGWVWGNYLILLE